MSKVLELDKLAAAELEAAAASSDTFLFAPPALILTAPSNEIGARYRAAWIYARASRMVDEASASPSWSSQRIYLAAQTAYRSGQAMALTRLTPEGLWNDRFKTQDPAQIARYFRDQAAWLASYDQSVLAPAIEAFNRLADPARIAAAQAAAGEAPGIQRPSPPAPTLAPVLLGAGVVAALLFARTR
jgi:hypothetical protein